MSELKITKTKIELNNKIQEQVLLLNDLLSKCCEEKLLVDITTPGSTIGKDGHANCLYYNKIKINLFVRI